MEFIKKNIKWVTVGICILSIVGLFLPFLTVSSEFLGEKISQSVSFIDGDGSIVFATIVVALVFIFLNKDIVAVVPLLVGFGITLYDALNGMSKINEFNSMASGV